ncbi:uncharacterized protein DFL_005231 [Arthrobotrys flagrans]|uniref:Biogenesis of lysosome-related organelles complex 1 subunit 7 n=1 Tax=Arthrobotrys flagrans TaxID=97331 RepID=A0A437A754_ARTFL|nr:hypothetical protein DFL_005231 [Arthrobotrys flagrans]
MSASTSLAGSPPSLSGNLSPSPPRVGDPLASGLRTLFDPTIRQTTEKLWIVHQSQIALAEELERLISQLNHYLETTDPPLLKPTIVKLASVGKRLNAVNAQLHAIQGRVSRLFIQLSKQKAINKPNNAASTSATAPGSNTATGLGTSNLTSSSPAAAALAAAAGVGISGSSASGSRSGG